MLHRVCSGKPVNNKKAAAPEAPAQPAAAPAPEKSSLPELSAADKKKALQDTTVIFVLGNGSRKIVLLRSINAGMRIVIMC